MACKICGHKDRELIEKLISDGCRPVDIINEFKFLSYANLTNHTKHMNKSNIQNMQMILDNSMTAENIQKMKADNVGDLLRLASYLEQHPEEDNTMKQFRNEFESRLAALSGWLDKYYVKDWKTKDDEMWDRTSLLEVVRVCMVGDLLEDGKINLHDILLLLTFKKRYQATTFEFKC